MKTAITLLTLLALVNTASAGIYIQCADGGSLVSNILNTLGTLLGNLLQGPCESGCTAGGYDYSIWSPALSVLSINLLNMCYCANSANFIPSGTNAKVASSGTTCAAGGLIGLGVIFPDWTVTWLKPGVWSLLSCKSGATLTGGPTAGVANTEQCYEMCKRYKYAAFTYTGVNTVGCTCGTFLSGGTDVPCTTSGSWSTSAAIRRGLEGGGANIYINAAPAISALGQQRRAIEAQRRAEALARDNAYCPEGFTGCSIPDSTQYECIDTKTELESCGGCVHGAFGNSTSSAGVDCTTLRGVSIGGVTCDGGHCQVNSCRRGFKLKDGRCVRASTRR